MNIFRISSLLSIWSELPSFLPSSRSLKLKKYMYISQIHLHKSRCQWEWNVQVLITKQCLPWKGWKLKILCLEVFYYVWSKVLWSNCTCKMATDCFCFLYIEKFVLLVMWIMSMDTHWVLFLIEAKCVCILHHTDMS